MIRFVLADLRRLWAGSAVIVLLVALAVALGVAVTLQERALRLGSARASDKFDLVVGAAVDVVEDRRRQPAPGQTAEVVEIVAVAQPHRWFP